MNSMFMIWQNVITNHLILMTQINMYVSYGLPPISISFHLEMYFSFVCLKKKSFVSKIYKYLVYHIKFCISVVKDTRYFF